MMDDVEILLTVNSDFWDKPPHIKVFIDETIIYDDLVTQEENIKWHEDLEEGSHAIHIELLDKTYNQTVLDEKGTILKDQLVNIVNIAIDDIEMSDILWKIPIYYPTPDSKDPDRPSEIIGCNNLGYNGRWTFNFSVPTYIWMLENIV